MTEYIILVALCTYFIAGSIKGMFGIGFPTAAIALTATIVDARTAIAYVIIPMCVLNAWQIYRSGHLFEVVRNNWRMVLSMLLAIGIFSVASADIPIRWLTFFVGLITGLFALVSLLRAPPEIPDKYNHMAQWIAGTVSGAIGGIAGIWAPPIIAYLSARRVERDVFIQTVGVLLFVGSLVLLVGYTRAGLINSDNALQSTLLLLPAIAGFTLGEHFRNRITSEVFHKLILVLFLVLGLNLIRRAILM